MANLSTLNLQFVISLFIIIIGYTLKRTHVVDKNGAGKGFARIIFNVTLPAVILQTLTNIKIDVAMIAMPFFAFLITGIVYAVAKVEYRKTPDKMKRGQLIMMSLGYNVGNFAYPLIEGVFGVDGLKYAAMFDAGNAFVIFMFCYILAMLYSAKDDAHVQARYMFKKVFTSPPLLSYILGIVLNVVGFQFPDFISNAGNSGIMNVIAKANTFITFLVLGIYLDFNLDKSYWKNLIKVMITRYGIGIALGLAVFLLWPVDIMPRTILLVCLILPVGMGLLIFVVQCGYDEKFAGMLSNLMNMISFGLIWVILLVLSIA
ncbi:MAG TPA: AEC family transporter [Candidatus Lokiarchaeia archaeon]|nr:AEC family transporter [Candidatus Lokiarchaeia archaeon]